MENEENKENQQKTEDMQNIFPYKECEQYINLLQENINRMANNSANCKNWLVAILAGVCALGWEHLSGYTFCLLLIPILLFCFLDCLYLGLERSLIQKEKQFINNCKNMKDKSTPGQGGEFDFKSALFDFKQESVEKSCTERWTNIKLQLCETCKAFLSLSTGPFYIVLILAVIVIAIVTQEPSCNCSCCCCM